MTEFTRRALLRLPAELKTVVFDWGYLAEDGLSVAVALGFGSLYNHDNPANMRFEPVAGERMLTFTTVRPVAKGEELTINYNAVGGGFTWDHSNHWFDRVKIKPITSSDPQDDGGEGPERQA